jgi:predicted DNA-binding transcriptional regulator AlpA
MKNTRIFDKRQLVDTRQAAAILGKHAAVLADWRHQGRGPRYVKMGKSVRYRLDELDLWVEANTIDPSAK